jgi:hypothetical protein
VKEKEKMTVSLGEEVRIQHIIDLLAEREAMAEGTLLTHTFVQSEMERLYGVSGTLIRKYIRHALMRGLLTELRPSYDGSIGGIAIVTGNPVYIEAVRAGVRYRLTDAPGEMDHPRQLALLSTPMAAKAALYPFMPVEAALTGDCE